MSYFPLCSHYSFFYTPKLDRFYLSLWNYSSGWTYFFFFFPVQVIVLCAAPLKIKEIMLAAEELNMVDSGDYVFFNIELRNRFSYVSYNFFFFAIDFPYLF